MWLESLLALVALTAALATRPWRLLASRKPLVHESHGAASPLWTPLLATLVFLPWLWALPTLHAMPLQLQWSGACLVVLMLGWPLAIPALIAVGATACVISPTLAWTDALGATVEFLTPKEIRHQIGLHRHLTGDWQAMCKADRDANWVAVLDGETRVFSSFDIAPKGHAGKPIKIWVITVWDRSVTTVLRPEDY